MLRSPSSRSSILDSRFSILFLALALAVAAYAHDAQPPALPDIGIEQRLNEQVPLGLVFQDEAGRSVRLGDYFGQKPVILALVSYECRMLCPLRLEGLVNSLRALSLSAGEQFAVVTVSVDPRETPALAAAVKQQYLSRYARPSAEEGWHFLTGEETAIEQLAGPIGFRYTYVAQQDQYVHANGITILTAQGTIARYFYGIEYASRDLRFALLEASAGRVGSLVDQVLLLCYRYDPTTGRYSAIALTSVRLGGVFTVLALGSFIGVMWHRERRGKRGKTGRVR